MRTGATSTTPDLARSAAQGQAADVLAAPDVVYRGRGWAGWSDFLTPSKTDLWRRLRGMKWVTRERPRIDRVACAWLIKRFLDPQPEFLFAPNDEVFVVAEREGATPFHVRGSELGRTPDAIGFDAIMRVYQLGHDDPALQRLATIVRGADVYSAASPPESAGLRAVMNGYTDAYADDHELLNVATTVYEALYQWCRHQR